MHRFAVITSCSTLLLIAVGGLVTSTGSGLAVPDWPLSYGQFFPKMVGGVLYEHGHRMVAATVGLMMTVLAAWILIAEPRRWVGWLAGAALFAVILQGILGGITVLFLLPTAVSVTHACLAQAFFCLTVVLAVVTGSRWRDAGRSRPLEEAGGARLATMAGILTLVVYLQLILGAVMRHTGAGLAIPDFPLAFGALLPPLDSLPVAIHFSHRLGAVAVSAVAVWVAGRVVRRHRGESLLMRPVVLLLILVAVQISLGALTVWSSKAVIPTTAHVACGAAVLATSLVLALRAHRLSRARTATAPLRVRTA